MYQAFYGLREKPFSLLPDPSFFYLSRPHTMAYTVLEYGIVNQAGFTVITGEVGTGKTTLIRRLLNDLDSRVTVGLITNTGDVAGDLLRWILSAFRQDYKRKETVELQEVFEDFLLAEYAAGRRVVLVVDEAQSLTVSTLESLRMLSNINADKDLLLQTVLVGQPQLKVKLERPELHQLAQRVVASYHLTALSEAETLAYIQHRLNCAGAARPLFSLDACGLVYTFSGGVPRIINLVCDTALVYGYAEAAQEIGVEIVQSVISDRSDRLSGICTGTAEKPHVLPRSSGQRPASNGEFCDRTMARELFQTLRKR